MPRERQWEVRACSTSVGSASDDRLTWAHSSGMPGVSDQTCRSDTDSTPRTWRGRGGRTAARGGQGEQRVGN